jgi:hypothetical protein
LVVRFCSCGLAPVESRRWSVGPGCAGGFLFLLVVRFVGRQEFLFAGFHRFLAAGPCDVLSPDVRPPHVIVHRRSPSSSPRSAR